MPHIEDEIAVPNVMLDSMIAEGEAAGSELEPTVHALKAERIRRGLLLAATEMDNLSHGVYDAKDGTPDAPTHTDSIWAAWMEPKAQPTWPKLP